MTNLEKYKEKIKDMYSKDEFLGDVIYKVAKSHGYKYDRGICQDVNVIDWLLEECREPYKLKQWEYDLLKYLDEASVISSINDAVCNYKIVVYFMKNDHFKGIQKGDTFNQVFENYEIVPDDYDFEKNVQVGNSILEQYVVVGAHKYQEALNWLVDNCLCVNYKQTEKKKECERLLNELISRKDCEEKNNDIRSEVGGW